MKTIVIATKNVGKAKEFEQMLQPLGYEVKTLVDYSEIEDIEETGQTFAENATIKAETLSKILGIPVIADDSGLVVEALNGEPGVYSARYAGEPKSDKANYELLLKNCENITDRTAYFCCVLAVAVPNQPTRTVEGRCYGEIASEPSGTNGFGYDPVFYVPSEKCTMANLSKDEKNKISHRGAAIEKLKETILPTL